VARANASHPVILNQIRPGYGGSDAPSDNHQRYNDDICSLRDSDGLVVFAPNIVHQTPNWTPETIERWKAIQETVHEKAVLLQSL